MARQVDQEPKAVTVSTRDKELAKMRAYKAANAEMGVRATAVGGLVVWVLLMSYACGMRTLCFHPFDVLRSPSGLAGAGEGFRESAMGFVELWSVTLPDDVLAAVSWERTTLISGDKTFKGVLASAGGSYQLSWTYAQKPGVPNTY